MVTDGLADETCDTDSMLREMHNIKGSLRVYIMKSYLNSVRNELSSYNGKPGYESLLLPSTSLPPVTEQDFKTLLGKLENNEVNQRVVHHIFFQFHKDRMWLAERIDEWFKANNMKLLEASDAVASNNAKKTYQADRGGFTAVARFGKNQAIGNLMDPMLKKAGWCIATKKNQGKKTCKTYTEVFVDGIKKKRDSFYVVTIAESAVDEHHQVYIFCAFFWPCDISSHSP